MDEWRKKKQIKPSVLVLGKTEKTLASGEMPSPGQTREIPRLLVLSSFRGHWISDDFITP